MGKVLAFIITGFSTYGGISIIYDMLIGGKALDILSMYYMIWFLGAVIFGAITNHVAKTKGYENGFLWGYWFGIIGLLVVGFRADKKTSSAPRKSVARSGEYDPVEHLERLSRLHSQGAITDDEFQKQKTLILSRM